MPRPTSSTTLQRPDLGTIAYEYLLAASRMGFIGLELLPIFETPEQSADYPVIPFEALLKLKDTARAPRGRYNRGDWEFEMGTYACKEHGWEEPVDETERALYARYFDAEEIATLRAMDTILRNQEKRIAAAVFNTNNITQTAAVSVEWSTAASATPLANVEAAKESMRTSVGLEPNVIAMSKKVFKNLVLTAEVKDAFKYTAPVETLPMEAKVRRMADYFGVDRVLVAGAIYDSAKEGQAASIADMWDDEYVGLFRVTGDARDLREPCLGRTFLWTGDSPSNTVVEQYHEDQTRSEIYRVRHNVNEAFVFTGAGYLLSNITA